MTFRATKNQVLNRGNPPDSFLSESVAWCRSAPDEIFAPNDNPDDIYALVKSRLATQTMEGEFAWDSLTHRRAAMMEAMRVHAGFESSWNWNEGVDTNNQTSMSHIAGQETGIFQVSFDSTYLGNGAMKPFAEAHGIETPETFIPAMKENHALCMEYYARLVRVSIAWAGPLVGHKILPCLSRASMVEFAGFLSD